METEIERYVPCRYLAGVFKRFDRERAVLEIHYIALVCVCNVHTTSNHAYALHEFQLKSCITTSTFQPPSLVFVIPFYFPGFCEYV